MLKMLAGYSQAVKCLFAAVQRPAWKKYYIAVKTVSRF